MINGTWTVKGALQEVSYERDSNKVIATFADKNASAPLYWAVKLGDKVGVSIVGAFCAGEFG